MPRIQPRYAQLKGGRGGVKGKGFPGGGFGALAEAIGVVPKAATANNPKSKDAQPETPQGPDSPSTAALLQFTGPAPATPVQSPMPEGTPESPTSPGDAFGGAIGGFLDAIGTGVGSILLPPKEITVTTSENAVQCRQYPDVVSTDKSKSTVLAKGTELRVTCWTSASIAGASGKVQGSSLWLRAQAGCYISEMNVQDSSDFEKKLPACEPVYHFVGTMQPQYKRQDCYNCTNTSCASKNIGSGNLIDLGCATTGVATAGNS